MPETQEATTERASAPIPLLVVAWLVPGLGHFILGRRRRAAVFAFTVVAAFVTGILLSGELAVPERGNPFSWIATLGCLGNGALYFLGKVFRFGVGDPTALGYFYGKTFLYTGGLMNLLAVLDASDIAKGDKD